MKLGSYSPQMEWTLGPKLSFPPFFFFLNLGNTLMSNQDLRLLKS